MNYLHVVGLMSHAMGILHSSMSISFHGHIKFRVYFGPMDIIWKTGVVYWFLYYS